MLLLSMICNDLRLMVYFEFGSLKNFGKSDMKTGGNFGFIAVECFVSIGEDIVIGKVI